MNHLKLHFLAAVIFVVIVSVSAFSQSTNEITLGALAPLSGEYSGQGQIYKDAMELAVEDFNAYLARENYPYHLTVRLEDTATDPAQAMGKLQELAQAGIRYVIGPFTSGCVAAVKDFADQNGILIISPSSTAVSLAIADDNVFRLVPDDSRQAGVIVNDLRQRGITKVISLSRDDDFGRSLSGAAQNLLSQAGGDYQNPIIYDPAITDFSQMVATLNQQVEAAVTEVGSASTAVHLIAFGETKDIFRLAADYPALSSVFWCGNDGVTGDQSVLEDSAAAEFAVSTRFSSPAYAPMSPSFQIREELKRRLREKTNRESNDMAVSAYDSVWLGAWTYMDAQLTDDFSILKQVFLEKLPRFYGYFSTIILNTAGDRSLGLYHFYSIEKTETAGYRWTKDDQYCVLVRNMVMGPYPFNVNPTDFPSDTREFAISALLPLTGSLASAGQSARQILEMAKDDVNSLLASNNSGLRIRLQIEDTATDPAQTLTRLQALKSSLDSPFVIGPFDSASLETVRSYANENQIILISPSSTAPSLAIPDDNLFRFILGDVYQAEAMTALWQAEGIQAVAPIVRNDLYGNELLAALHAKTIGSESTHFMDGVHYDPDTTDFAPIMNALSQKISDAAAQYGRAAVAVQLISFEEAAAIFSLAKQNEILRSVRWFGCDANNRLEIIRQNPELTEFALQTRFTTSAFSPELYVEFGRSGRSRRNFVENFITLSQQAQGREPSAYDYGVYDAIWLAALTHLVAGWDASFESLKQQFPLIAENNVGYCGPTNLTPDGDFNHGSFGFSELKLEENDRIWAYSALYFIGIGLRDNEESNHFFQYYEPDFPPISSSAVNWELYW
ncbi:MAG: amino acid ABC transporter substrate-binding protein [Candidatus Omnitrophota bacterium]|jgi:branched-chain amino acid transport system substrate-binding protein|nr:MAG: amino acid ABC transporter substrate-binding protein [Candidatus Omnitrophota bacterium]